MCSAGCLDSRCRCTYSCGDASDVAEEVEATDVAVDRVGDGDSADGVEGDVRDGDAGETTDVDPDAGPCLYRSSGETRPGASPGVSCTRITVWENEYYAWYFSGDGDRIVVSGAVSSGAGSAEYIGSCLWEYRRSTGCSRLVHPALTPVGSTATIAFPSSEGALVAYSWGWRPTSDVEHCLVGLLDLESGEDRTLTSSDSRIPAGDHSGCSIISVSLEAPWVVWADNREVPVAPPDGTSHRWDALATNIETGENINLNLDPTTSARLWRSTFHVDLEDGLAVFDAAWGGSPTADPFGRGIVGANVLTGERLRFAEASADLWYPDLWYPVLASSWIAWLDQRHHPECDSFTPCSTDVYGFDLATGTEQALVIAGDSMQGEELDADGPWVVYEDQRGGDDPTHARDREQDIYAFHLPTMTEVQITNWPGYEMNPQVYRRDDGSYGVLLAFELDRRSEIYPVWDCDLPEPGSGGR
ncbi:MAG: hypothetical protein HY905_17920 [Deltaproteobacteria bacterium]|nr:hypothetical protein [Deltaproteobacteria bacterium]